MASNPDAASPLSPEPTPILAPVSEHSRIEALDAVRGFALLGIFLVNIQSFAEPLAKLIDHKPSPGSTTLEAALFYAIKTIAEGKFYPLFSILFGMGLILQFNRASSARRSFAPLYLRRLLVLALFGLAHGLLLWYGDILFLYAVVGVPLLLMRKLRPKTMLIISVVLIAISSLTWTGFAALGTVAEQHIAAPARPESADAAGAAPVQNPASESADNAPPAVAKPPQSPQNTAESVSPPSADASKPRTALDILAPGFETGEVYDPTSDLRKEAEIVATRDGPYLHALIVRALNWSTFMMVSVIALGWQVAAMFLLGAALMKWNIFDDSRRPLRRTLAILGLGIGLPLAAFASLAPLLLGLPGVLIQALLVNPLAPIVALGYLAGVSLLADSGRARPLVRALANAGRMALTVYLLETIISCAIFQHWGLALFGQVPRTPRLFIVLAIYGSLVVFASLWLRVFVMGPFEWLWRTLTYLRPQPLLRRQPRA